ncbi:MAG: hypothetical protein V2A76_09745 [Planctomycetota bacterium]
MGSRTRAPATSSLSDMNTLNFCLVLVLLRFLAGEGWPQITLAPEGTRVDLGPTCLLSGFVFLPKGALAANQKEICLRSGSGARHPTQAWGTSEYADRSVRSLRLVAEVPSRLTRSAARLEVVKGASPPPSKRLRVTERNGGVTVDTGALELALSRVGPDLIDSLRVGGCALHSPSRPARVLVSAGAGLFSSEFETSRAVGVSQRGPIRCCVTVRGLLTGPEGDAAASYRIGLAFLAGSAIVELELTVEALSDCGLAEDLCFELPLELGHTPAVEILGTGSRLALERRGAQVAALDGRRLLGLAAGERLVLDPARRAGLLLSGSPCAAVAMAVSRMLPNAPRMLEAMPPGDLRLALYAGPFFLEAGQSYRCDFALAAFSRAARSRVLPCLTREHLPSLPGLLNQQEVMPGLSPLPGEEDGALAGAAPLLLRVVEEALVSEAGMTDYGDYRYLDGFANLEYDPAAAFMLRYLENGDGRSLTLARDQLCHLVTHDFSRGEKGAPVGFPWMHGAEHRSETFEAGHVWAAGLVLGCMVLGEPEWLSAAEELRRALADVCGDGASFRAERSYGWSILALEDLQLLAPNPDSAGISRRLIRDLIRTQDQRGYFRIDPAREETGAVFAPTPWVTAGITMEALYRHHLRTGDGQARASLDLAAEFLMRDARDEDGAFSKKVYFGDDLVNGMGRAGRASAVDLMLIATRKLPTTRLDANQACRALQALRSLADTNRILQTD